MRVECHNSLGSRGVKCRIDRRRRTLDLQDSNIEPSLPVKRRDRFGVSLHPHLVRCDIWNRKKVEEIYDDLVFMRSTPVADIDGECPGE